MASASHRFGSHRASTPATAASNLIWTALPSFGSGYQNNHHAFPHSARLGFKWWEIDVALWFIRGLELVGLASNLKYPTEAELASKRVAR